MKNLAAKINSSDPISDLSRKLSPSGPCKDSRLQPSVISYIREVRIVTVFPNPHTKKKKIPQAYSKQEYTIGTDKPSKRRDRKFYSLGEIRKT